MVSISTSQVGQATLIEIKGRIDSMNAAQVSSVIDRQLARDHTQILLQLTEVEYMSAAGLRILKTLHGQIGNLRLVNPSQRVRDILGITGLDAVYKQFDTITEAIHAVNRITNAHTHLELSWLKDACPGVTGLDFVDWITNTVDARWDALGSNWETIFEHAVHRGIEQVIEAGTTLIADVTNTGKSIKPLLESSLRGLVYVEVLGPDANKAEAHLNKARTLIESWRPKERPDMRIGLSIHAPYSTHPELWKKAVAYAREEDLPLCIHVAESDAEYAFMTVGKDTLKPYYDLFESPPVPSPGKSPIAFLEDIGALALKPLLVHGIHVDDDDIRRIKESRSTVVHCPRSNLRLRCGRMPLEKYLEQKVPVLIGTDSLASAPSLNVFHDVEVAAALHYGKVTPGEINNLLHGSLPGVE